MRLLFSGIGILFYSGLCTYIGAKLFGFLRYFLPNMKAFVFWLPFALFCYGFILINLLHWNRLNILRQFSGYWIALLMYLFLLLVLFDISRLAIFLINRNFINPRFNMTGMGTVLCLCLLIIVYGAINAYPVKTANYKINLRGQGDNFRIALISDIHIGSTVGRARVSRVVDAINHTKPDMVCIAGDIFDGNPGIINDLDGIVSELKRIHAPLGVYACLGNHDVDRMLGGGTGQIEKILDDAGIILLQDEAAAVTDNLYIIGRRDSRPIGMKAARKQPANLSTDLERGRTVIVLDHQPTQFAQIEKAGADLTLSGHTHKGQIFPATLLTKNIFKKAGGTYYGHWQGETMQAVVTSGAGFWGPPMRIGTNNEVAVIDIAFHRQDIVKIKRVVPSGITAQMYMLAIAPDLLCSLASRYISDLAEYIPEMVQRLPVTGQIFSSGEMNPETIAGLVPDLVIDIGEPKDTAGEDLENFSRAIAVPAIHIAATLRNTPDVFRSLGKLLGREEKGEELAAFCERVLAESEAAVKKADKKPSVLYCLGPAGTNVMAAGSFQSEVIDMMTHNIAIVNNPSAKGTGNETDMEQIFLWNPEIIIFAPDSIYDKAGSDPLWLQLPAIQKGNYYRTPSGPYNWLTSPPSINRYMGLLWLGKILYNAEYDLYEKAVEYYDLFYGYELKIDKYNKIINKE